MGRFTDAFKEGMLEEFNNTGKHDDKLAEIQQRQADRDAKSEKRSIDAHAKLDAKKAELERKEQAKQIALEQKATEASKEDAAGTEKRTGLIPLMVLVTILGVVAGLVLNAGGFVVVAIVWLVWLVKHYQKNDSAKTEGDA